ncbi:MAG: hypothetical protein C4527_20365 [Candidatus Omnitrophota bacterium]|nr:MAG: hypothetical protein C4527_20365 [Candidatus Omnitrophota bacterium]
MKEFLKQRRRLRFLTDFHWELPVLLLFTLLFYVAYLTPRCASLRLLTWDAFRDLITAQHLLAGGALLADPALHGFFCWYPPLHAFLCAKFIELFHFDVFTFYAFTPVFINWMLAPAFYCFCRLFLDNDNRAAFWATLALTVMPWPVTYVFAFPTVMAHAVCIAIPLFLWYVRLTAQAYGKGWILFSCCCGLFAYYHPPTFLIVSGIIVLHHGFDLFHDIPKKTIGLRLFSFVSISALISSPYWALNLSQPIKNPTPLTYISPAMLQLEVVLPGTSWLRSLPFLFLAAIGLWILVQRRKESRFRFLAAFVVISLAGQMPAYARILIDAYFPMWHERVADRIPTLLPHEFQLYFQLLLCILVGMGIRRIGEWKGRRRSLPYYCAFLYFLFCMGYSLYEFPARSQVFLWPYRPAAEWDDAVHWIHSSTSAQEVICTPDDQTAFFIVGARTGRKCLLSYASHVNPHVDVELRKNAREAIFTTSDSLELQQFAKEYEIRYILCKFNAVTPDRLVFFRQNLKTVFDDGTIFIFELRNTNT